MTSLQDKVKSKYGGKSKTEGFIISLKTKIDNRNLKPGFSQFQKDLKDAVIAIPVSLIMFISSVGALLRPVLNLVGIILVDIPAAWRISNNLEQDGILQDEGEVQQSE